MIYCTHRTAERNDGVRPVVFLDRDGTLTEYQGFITKPSQLRLVENSCETIRSLRSAGFAIVLITNQSAIGRGMITHEELCGIHSELTDLLAAGNAHLDAIYYCPEAPTENDETVIESPDRKPGPGMLIQAAEDLNLDLVNSWMVGDRVSDILAGQNAGCCGNILIKSDRLIGNCRLNDNDKMCNTLVEAATTILNSD